MKKIYFALLVALSTPLLSYADAEVKKSETPALFRGFYVGINLPYGVDYYTWKETGFWSGATSSAKSHLGATGFIPGGRIGYEYAFSNKAFLAIDLSGNYVYSDVKHGINGDYLGADFFEEDTLHRNGQFVYVGHLGGLITDKTILYFIGGGEFTEVYLKQGYQFSSMSSGIYAKRNKKLWGGVIGIGMGASVTNHVEVRIEGTKSYFKKFHFSEVHGNTSDLITLNTNGIYGNFSVLYRF